MLRMSTVQRILLVYVILVILLTVHANTKTLYVNVSAVLPTGNACGFVKATDRLYGSRATEIGEFPWVAAIEYKDFSSGELHGIKCIGSLINKKFILTAAHCLTKSHIEAFRVWLGDWKFSTDPDCISLPQVICGDPVEKVNIESKITHENFHKGTGEHDIALLRLKQEVHYTDFIQPLCLPIQDILNEDKFIAVSWGTTTQDGNVADVLQSISLPPVPIKECEEVLKKPLPSKVLCAGGEKGKDTCRGDGGAPLVKALTVYDEVRKHYDLRWFQYGITSWGIGCGREGYPAVYTSVFKYIDWICNNILAK